MLALHTVVYGWAVLESRSLVEVIPEHVRKLWNNWEIRVLVLVSLSLQLCLLHFGCRRRYSAKTWLSVFLWLSYLGADSVAIVALGVISNNQGNCDDSVLQNELIAFWAPFLLLHLGGQDTITAYAVQDNELWLRHLLGLVVQSGLAVYIILFSWEVSWLSFLTIPLFLAGFIKYAERIWVLKSANSDTVSGRRRSVIDATSGMDVALGLVRPVPEDRSRTLNIGIFQFFEIVRCRFLNQMADLPSYTRSYSDFRDSQTAWNMIERELGYAYDLYYTKAPLFFTARGFLIRAFSLTSIVIVFVCFLVKECHEHLFVDLIVTLLLLAGAILIEIYGVVLLCSSDWPVEWDFRRRSGLSGKVKGWLNFCIEAVRSGCAKLTSKQRWSNSMCQLDLFGFCLKGMSLQDGGGTPTVSSKFRGWALNKLNGELELLIHMTHKKVSDELKKRVFSTFTVEREWNSNGFVARKYSRWIIDGTDCLEPYQRIIIWHIATYICFYTGGDGDDSKVERTVSKDLSDYMMYILAMLPQVLSAGSAKRIFEKTCRDVRLCIGENNLSNRTEVDFCEGLLSLGCWSDLLVYKALIDNDLFPLGVLLARKLKVEPRMWGLLLSFWCENLVYVATHCPGDKHAQLLRNGGEFLTHVWLLEEHFNLTVWARNKAVVQGEAQVRSVARDNAGSSTG